MIDYLSSKLKVRKSILYTFFIVLLVSTYTFFLKPEINSINMKNIEIDELENKLKFVEEKISGISSTDLKEMEQKTQKIKTQYALGLESQKILLDIDKFAQKAELEILTFISQGSNSSDGAQQYQYTLRLLGNYNQFVHWLRLLETMPYYININNLCISNPSDINENNLVKSKDGKLLFELTINNIALDNKESYD